jgi:hypothetical protein
MEKHEGTKAVCEAFNQRNIKQQFDGSMKEAEILCQALF